MHVHLDRPGIGAPTFYLKHIMPIGRQSLVPRYVSPLGHILPCDLKRYGLFCHFVWGPSEYPSLTWQGGAYQSSELLGRRAGLLLILCTVGILRH